MLVRRSRATSSYQPVTVSMLRFDTSSLPDDAEITYAELQLHVVGRTDTDGRALVAEWYPAASWPIGSDDWTPVDADSAHPGTRLSELVAGKQQPFALRGLGAIDVKGMTALRLHVSGYALRPTGANDVVLATYDDPTLPAPTLVVTYRRGG